MDIRGVIVIEFGIADAPKKIGDEWHIIGRCVTDISVGDKFAKFIPYRKVPKETKEAVDYIRDAELPVDLTITRISAYGKELESWSAGLTAELVLSGNGDNLNPFGSLCG